MSTLKEVRRVFQGLQTLYHTYLPKIDPNLINDLLTREQKDSKTHPFYLVQIFTKEGTDRDFMRNYILEKTEMIPSIYDHGTHYVTNHKLSLELLKEFSDLENVLKVQGYYTGTLTGVGA